MNKYFDNYKMRLEAALLTDGAEWVADEIGTSIDMWLDDVIEYWNQYCDDGSIRYMKGLSDEEYNTTDLVKCAVLGHALKYAQTRTDIYLAIKYADNYNYSGNEDGRNALLHLFQYWRAN